MKLRLFLVSCLIAIGLIFFCCEKKRPESKMDTSNMIKNHSGYYYKREDAKKFLHRLKTIKIGDNYSTIVSQVGKPTYERTLLPKRGGSTSTVKVLDYYIRKYEKNFANERYDISIILVLGDDDTLKKIQSSPGDWFAKWPDVPLPD